MELGDFWEKIGDGVNKALEGVNRGITGLFGNSNERQVRRMGSRVTQINALEERMQALSDAELKELTPKLRARLADGETIDGLLVDAFAAAREAGRRFLRMRHYDVQLMGGMVLHQGKIAEMVTGEGKTLVATLPAYLNGLAGRGVHVVTVNDYLARRDAEWMNPIYTGLGLTVGAIQSDMDSYDRQHHYRCDITYGTNNEFGFDYLRDNMKPERDLQCQRELFYAIVDEVDSILIDEARTPLIISGPALEDPGKFKKANQIAQMLKKDVHFEIKEKEHTCHLTDAGVLEAERIVGVETFYTPGNMHWPHLIDNSLKANYLYKRDKDYIVDKGEIIIIDEHTGRKMIGRQWSDGLHQSVEAKENVKIKEETQTLATITFQNFFKLYKKIAGMTGTAMTEAQEFYKIYKLDVVNIPTNKTLIRVNSPDMIFCTEKEKWKAIVDEVKRVHRTGRPILVGTTSVEKSEKLSEMFERVGLKHEVLNAKFVEREAEIVAQAGKLNQITLATNMAGRGTDIILGGNPDIKAWTDLKHEYPTRLEVPNDVWRDTVGKYEGPMHEEGRIVAAPTPTLQLAKSIKVKDAHKFADMVDNASKSERRNAEALAKKHGLDEEQTEQLTDLVELYHAARPGGVHIVGTERHESRRIDNQLRGRSGRQGDPGSSRFFLSLEDDLMRIFMGDWVRGMLQRLGMKDGEAIESPMVSRRIAGAQKKVEERNFEIRKNLLEFDEIMDTQRKRVYGFRQEILNGAPARELMIDMLDRQIDKAIERYLDRNYGTKMFAAFAADRLGAKFEEKEFLRCDYAQAVELARDEAMRQAESAIVDAIDEHLSEDVEQAEWNWQSLTSWVNAGWGLKLKDIDLKRISRGKLGEHLYNQVKKVIAEVNLEGGEECFDSDFGLRNLVAWMNQKFTTTMTDADIPEDKRGADREELNDWLKEIARKQYVKKEVEFPVVCGMSQFMADKAHDSASRYDREGLIAWSKRRFGVELDHYEYRDLSRRKIMDNMMAVSEKFYGGGAFLDEIDEQSHKCFPGGPKQLQPAEAVAELSKWCETRFGKPLVIMTKQVQKEEIRRQLLRASEDKYRSEIRVVERQLLLQFLDVGWKDHLYGMDHLKSGIGLRGYAQLDAKVEYKREGRKIFDEMWEAVDNKVTDIIFRIAEADPGFVNSVFNVTNVTHEQYDSTTTSYGNDNIRQQQEAAIESSKGDQKTEPIRNKGKKLGRNDPCHCGSGKKYKNCHMNADRNKGRGGPWAAM